ASLRKIRHTLDQFWHVAELDLELSVLVAVITACRKFAGPRCLGSARVTRAGFGVPPKQSFSQSPNRRASQHNAKTSQKPEAFASTRDACATQNINRAAAVSSECRCGALRRIRWRGNNPRRRGGECPCRDHW